MSTNPPILDIQGVSKTFASSNQNGDTLALQATQLSVAENDFITILGPSGCGKSTLLRMVAGLDTPSTGHIRLDGKAVEGPGSDRGMVFQSYTLFPWLTVKQNVCFGLREKAMPIDEQQHIAHQFIRKVGLTGFENHFPRQLSGGMQQRTALARALANQPRILLMDEPFGALDHQTRELMQELLQGIWEVERKTVLFVTHDIKCDVPIELPHPRHYAVKTTPLFTDYKSHLTEEIRIEVQKATGLAVAQD
jgi:NitT/TauT family transport system ATP-binding protein